MCFIYHLFDVFMNGQGFLYDTCAFTNWKFTMKYMFEQTGPIYYIQLSSILEHNVYNQSRFNSIPSTI